MVFKQDAIPVGIELGPFWVFFFFFFESEHVPILISKKSAGPYKYHAVSLFIDDLCAINDDDEFSKSFKRKVRANAGTKWNTCNIFVF